MSFLVCPTLNYWDQVFFLKKKTYSIIYKINNNSMSSIIVLIHSLIGFFFGFSEENFDDIIGFDKLSQ